jgi:hypothetical protein
MNDLVARGSDALVADAATAPALGTLGTGFPAAPARHPSRAPLTPAHSGLPVQHPALFLDPAAWTVHAARELRRRGVPVAVLAASRLEPAGSVRGVRRQHLPPLETHPEKWQASLLELAAKLEPRPAIYACSPAAIALLMRSQRTLEPHFELANLRRFDHPAAQISPDTALHEALSRSEAALEVQVVLDTEGRLSGAAVLAWAAGAPPDILVTSVAGNEVLSRSEDWLGARRCVGYARLVWSPDRFGRLTLQAASSVPGPGLVLAAADGVDFATLAHAAAFGHAMPEQRPACRLVRRLATAEGAHLGIGLPVRFEWRDPLPATCAFLQSLKRS